MSEKLIKEKISWYKLLFAMSITILAVYIGWFVVNLDFPVKWILLFNETVIILLPICMGIFVYKIRFYFNELGECDD